MRRVLFVIGAAALAACSARSRPQLPPAAPPSAWSEQDVQRVGPERADVSRWWSTFDDPILDELVRSALASNLDGAQALERIRAARARAGIAHGELGPSVDLAGGVSRSHYSENGPLGSLGGGTSTQHELRVESAWELDLFGELERRRAAADADLAASVEDARAVQVAILAEVASAYIDLRAAQNLAAVARRNATSARDTLALTRSRQRGGLGTDLDVARAETLLASSEARLPGFEAAERVAIHRLAVLLARPPADVSAELTAVGPIPRTPERVVVGLPSDLLQRRPDVRRAAWAWEAAAARVGVADAARYPSVSLTAAFGLESVDASDLADAASRAWSIGPVLRWPIFASGRLDAALVLADAQAAEAGIAYRRSFLVALEEVENELVLYLRAWDRRRVVLQSVGASRRAVGLADDLFRRGLTTFLDVLDAQRGLHDSEIDLVESEAATARHVVALYRSLGGGWEIADA